MPIAKQPVKIKVKVVPGASSRGVVGWLGAELKVRVMAAPEKNKANQAIVSLLADWLQVPAASIKLVSGSRSAHKIFEISGVSQTHFEAKVGDIN